MATSTFLVWASYRRCLRTVKKCLEEKDVNINQQDRYGNTALFYASWPAVHLEIFKLLMQKGIGINIQNKDGDTALIWASGKRSFEVVKLLVEAGADINIRDRNGETALMRASGFWNVNVENYLTSLKGPLSLQHIVLNLIEKCNCETNTSDELCSSHISHKGLPDILFVR